MRNCDSQVQTVERMNKGATIVEAVKLAKEMEPESVAVGEMPHCLHLKPDTPSDVLRWCLRRSLASRLGGIGRHGREPKRLCEIYLSLLVEFVWFSMFV